MREIDSALHNVETAEEVEDLIKAGANPNAKDDTGQPILIDYAKKGKKDAVEALIKAGADVNVSYGGMSVLFWAETPEIAKILLEAGTNADARDPFGRTAVMKRIDEKEMVTALVENGVDVNAKDKYGKTALFYARKPEIIKILIKAGADVNAQDNNGVSVLSSTVGDRNRNIEKVKVLLELGADVYIKDDNGKNALSRARSQLSCRSPEIKALVEAYARAEENDKEDVLKQSVESENAERIVEKESQKPKFVKEAVNGQETETKYMYYPDGKLLSVTITTNGKPSHFEHYDKNGNDDTRIYLAKKKIAERQTGKSEQLREKGVQVKNKDGTTRDKKAVKKLGAIQKFFAMKKALKEVDKDR